MIQRMGFDPDAAIAAFNEARGHSIERDNCLKDLRKADWPLIAESTEDVEPTRSWGGKHRGGGYAPHSRYNSRGGRQGPRHDGQARYYHDSSANRPEAWRSRGDRGGNEDRQYHNEREGRVRNEDRQY